MLSSRVGKYLFLPATVVVGALGVFLENKLSTEEDKESRSTAPEPAWQRNMDASLANDSKHNDKNNNDLNYGKSSSSSSKGVAVEWNDEFEKELRNTSLHPTSSS